jgi:hypothetical protein
MLSPRRLFYARASKYLATHHRSPFVQRLDAWCRSIHRWVENSNYDPVTNGERRALASLTEVSTIFDVGANVGEWALMAHRLHPRASIHAFEIVPETCRTLCRNTAGVAEVVANCFGLADVRGVLTVKHFPGSSLVS